MVLKAGPALLRRMKCGKMDLWYTKIDWEEVPYDIGYSRGLCRLHIKSDHHAMESRAWPVNTLTEIQPPASDAGAGSWLVGPQRRPREDHVTSVGKSHLIGQGIGPIRR